MNARAAKSIKVSISPGIHDAITFKQPKERETLLDRLNRQKAEHHEALMKISGIENLINKIKDLDWNEDRWHKERLVSESAVKEARKCDVNHSCGCCIDAPLFVWPYIEIDGFKVYTPDRYCIGESNVMGTGDVPNQDWLERLVKSGIHPDIIETVNKYLLEHAPVDFDTSEGLA